MRRLIPFLVLGFAAFALAQDGPLTNGGNIPVRTDGNGYLLAAAQTYAAPDGPRRPLANALVRTDGNGYLIVTNPTGFGSPFDAQYWVGAANATLTAEKNLGALATALVVNTAGVPSAYAGVSCTNQFLRALSAIGASTCATVSLTADVTGTLPLGNGGTGSTSFTAGSVIFSNGTILTQDNANLFWDDSSNFLRVSKLVGGTATTSDLTFQTTTGVGAAGADMHFLVGNNGATEALTVFNSGNIGIGNTNPQGKLQVDGSIYVASDNGNIDYAVSIGGLPTAEGGIGYNAKFGSSYTYGGTDFSSILEFPAGGFRFKTAPSGTAGNAITYTTAMQLHQTGNLTLGAAGSAARLNVGASQSGKTTVGNSRVLILNNTDGGVSIGNLQEIGMGYGGVTYQPVVLGHKVTALGDVTKGDFYIATRDATTDTAPTERFYITSSGNVGIGTTVFPSTGTASLIFGDGTIPATMGANTSGLYANDVAGTVKMHGINEDGITGVLGLVQTKTDTGDPTGSEGLFVINTFDNTFKVYADGAWRTLASGW